VINAVAYNFGKMVQTFALGLLVMYAVPSEQILFRIGRAHTLLCRREQPQTCRSVGSLGVQRCWCATDGEDVVHLGRYLWMLMGIWWLADHHQPETCNNMLQCFVSYFYMSMRGEGLRDIMEPPFYSHTLADFYSTEGCTVPRHPAPPRPARAPPTPRGTCAQIDAAARGVGHGLPGAPAPRAPRPLPPVQSGHVSSILPY